MYSFFKKYLNLGVAMDILVIHTGLRECELNYTDYIIFFGIFISKPFFKKNYYAHNKQYSKNEKKNEIHFKNCLIFSISLISYMLKNNFIVIIPNLHLCAT